MEWTPSIGDLIWVPRVPLGLFAKTGDPDFWKLGIITSMDKHDCVNIFLKTRFLGQIVFPCRFGE